MNFCDYIVEEVIKKASNKKEYSYEWWEVKVSYYYDNDELKTKKLIFNSKEEAEKVSNGYKFIG